MSKSKELHDDSDSEETKTLTKINSTSDEESSKTSVSKKLKSKNSEDENDPPAKRTKKNDETDDSTAPSTIGPNGERLFEIGKLRYVSVSQFRGKSYINIREYYEVNGVLKPGISLGGEQWEKLKELINQVDTELKNSK
ncbi:unnamed protein product [Adineta steineri]|uniref:Transcriptional coactivator p15 (PC4) C-terminal domain-containing protein n=1 Tax=Adineta steineri TaxID=433720 RepID=A0A819M8A7_9BILA|nr:unnamed protein product [Adineta steineri]